MVWPTLGSRTAKEQEQDDYIFSSNCPVCVCMCVYIKTFELSDLWPRNMSHWFMLTVASSSLKIKLGNQSSQSLEEKFLFSVMD